MSCPRLTPPPRHRHFHVGILVVRKFRRSFWRWLSSDLSRRSVTAYFSAVAPFPLRAGCCIEARTQTDRTLTQDVDGVRAPRSAAHGAAGEVRVSLAKAFDHLTICLHVDRSEEHTSELQSRSDLVCRLLLEKKK